MENNFLQFVEAINTLIFSDAALDDNENRKVLKEHLTKWKTAVDSYEDTVF